MCWLGGGTWWLRPAGDIGRRPQTSAHVHGGLSRLCRPPTWVAGSPLGRGPDGWHRKVGHFRPSVQRRNQVRDEEPERRERGGLFQLGTEEKQMGGKQVVVADKVEGGFDEPPGNEKGVIVVWKNQKIGWRVAQLAALVQGLRPLRESVGAEPGPL
ncbi:hypothetical protein AXF42_Ash009196 [Apostasia shenzhenica]|uniref:Uncharacterized protein n=1 Tax=Apostasia shenzhenica TaxID=1088818 RepID=A0A2I0ADR7_9ASPA|nr:hypothetical protein AXF42_Ash009196 [Apostasia shenzhenica]